MKCRRSCLLDFHRRVRLFRLEVLLIALLCGLQRTGEGLDALKEAVLTLTDSPQLASGEAVSRLITAINPLGPSRRHHLCQAADACRRDVALVEKRVFAASGLLVNKFLHFGDLLSTLLWRRLHPGGAEWAVNERQAEALLRAQQSFQRCRDSVAQVRRQLSSRSLAVHSDRWLRMVRNSKSE